MKVRRDILLFAAVAVAALLGGWWIVTQRPGAAIDKFVSARKQQAAMARPHLPAADAFRVTICPGQACAAVEAGGLTFIWGAGAGAAAGVQSLGLMHPDIDGILLPDTDLRAVEGLAGLAQASAGAGRTMPLKVFAPSSALTVVDGANLLAATAPAPRLTLSPDGADEGLAGKLLFDSGVVEIRAFGAVGRVYRIEFDGKSLVLAGCHATEEDILAATRGAQASAGVFTAGSAKMLADQPVICTDIDELAEAAQQSRLTATVVIPAEPAATIPGALAAWSEILLPKPKLTLGIGGARIDLAGATAHASGAS